MIKSSLLNYELPNSSINQEPYENPLDSKLLIAENREIISFCCMYAFNEECLRSRPLRVGGGNCTHAFPNHPLYIKNEL